MLNFRQKIFLTYVLVFLAFLALMSPFSSWIVHRIVKNAMRNRALELIARIETAPNNEAMLKTLKELKPLIFFRVSVITDERKVLYDSHTKRLLGPRFSQEHVVDHSEVLDALEYGEGYAEDYSDILEQKFAYTAIAFNFHGKKYVMRTAFPFRYVKELKDDFEWGFLLLATGVLVLFSTLTWFVINYLTRPIQKIISAVAEYKEGRNNPLPNLRKIEKQGLGEDIGLLVTTLISLSERIEKHIATLREERNEKEILLESLVEGIVAVDRQGRITFANQAARKFLGLIGQEINGVSFKELHQEKAYSLLLSSQHMMEPKIESMRTRLDERNFFLDMVAVPKQDKNGAVLVLIDQTEHHKLLEMRKDFVANASHELKTPITIIRGFAETLYDHPDLPREITQDVTKKIVKNCERMTLLIGDLLALSDIENLSSSRIHEVELVELLTKVKQTALELFPDAHVEFIHSEPQIYIEGDVSLLEMAFLNLVQNGLKYSESPAEVRIIAKVIQDKVKIEVIDKGIGIPEQDIPRIFERFYRVDKNLSKKVGGSGLGLAIVENVIIKHFGKISVTSTVGQGSTFTILLPIMHA